MKKANQNIWQPNFLAAKLQNPKIYIPLLIAATLFLMLIFFKVTSSSGQSETQTTTQFGNLSRVVITVDEDSRPTLAIGNRVDLWATDFEGQSRMLAKESYVADITERKVMVAVSKAELADVVSALAQEKITLVLN